MSDSSERSLNEPASAYCAPGIATEDLEFPDWTGHLPHKPRMSADEWLAYCRSNLPLMRCKPGYQERRSSGRVAAEFVL